LLTCAGLAGVNLRPLAAADTPAPEAFPKDGAEALQRLKDGNARFAAGKTRHAHESADWRKHLVAGQQPLATVLGCSDSRVPPELVFDQGFGDLFVIRVAGNVVAADVVGSLAYAALHLGTPLIVVMGHAGCGAVTAAVDGMLKQVKEPERIETLLKLIEPGLADLDLKQAAPARLPPRSRPTPVGRCASSPACPGSAPSSRPDESNSSVRSTNWIAGRSGSSAENRREHD